MIKINLKIVLFQIEKEEKSAVWLALRVVDGNATVHL